MRVIAPLPRPVGEIEPIPLAAATGRESVVVSWWREIAADIAASVGSAFDNAEYLLRPYPHTFVPDSLYSSFLIAGRTVAISVLWGDLWREPGFGLAIDGQPVPLDTTSTARPAAVIAHAAWQSILAATNRRAQ
ncbi:hypothetical protein I0C86_38185 [Plantactinospora sp. S1510]|uniref:Uncharacterized protein n=1 Tax=Plantactinospora alkalitolerans TaxID=2789879 RepID=A0ABS0H8D1_9ACTN|nr:hypothetical protein [Plantactinospora alkalitolerans]MBF9134719.1 hypothetical protein [Plantactinospora alkalitolerans]